MEVKGTAGPSMTPQRSASANGSKPTVSGEKKLSTSSPETVDWESERQLVDALASLQALEAKIHRLRTLVPGRLLAPLASIVNPGKAEQQTWAPKTPQETLEQLSQAARNGAAEVEAFKQEWRSPNMKLIWDRIDEKLRESGGEYPQPSGMWERDYDVLLTRLEREEKGERSRKRKADEEIERERQVNIPGGWKGIIESFKEREAQGMSIDVLPSEDGTGRFVVKLYKVSMTLYVQQQKQAQNDKGWGEWRVMVVPNGNASKLETAISDYINARERKFDLVYLLDMMSSYTDIKRTRCTKCGKLTDNTGQLAIARKQELMDAADSTSPYTWRAYHSGCL